MCLVPGTSCMLRGKTKSISGVAAWVSSSGQQTVGFELLCSTSVSLSKLSGLSCFAPRRFPSANCRVCVACLHFCFPPGFGGFVLWGSARQVTRTWGMRRARDSISAMKLHLKGVWLPSLAKKTRSLGLTFLLCQLEVRCVHGRELGGVPQQSIKNTRVAQMERHVHKGFLSPVLALLLAIPSKVGWLFGHRGWALRPRGIPLMTRLWPPGGIAIPAAPPELLSGVPVTLPELSNGVAAPVTPLELLTGLAAAPKVGLPAPFTPPYPPPRTPPESFQWWLGGHEPGKRMTPKSLK